MARALAEIEEEIRALAPEEKERLLRSLLEDLDGPADADAERAWLEETQRRSVELDTRLVSPVPAEDVFHRAREDLKRR